jgi:hypothetical protein
MTEHNENAVQNHRTVCWLLVILYNSGHPLAFREQKKDNSLDMELFGFNFVK